MENKKYPKISVVMLNYNGLAYLKKTIAPILKLNYSNYEFIIVDNGSTDESIEFINSFKNIKLIENGENLGYSKGKNIGIEKSTGEYLLVIDNDIIIKDFNFISELIKLYNDNFGFIQIPLLDCDKKLTKHYGIYYCIYGANPNKLEKKIADIISSKLLLVKVVGPCGACFFCSRDHWDRIGWFDESQKFNIDDVDIGPRACIYGFNNYLYTNLYFTHLGINKTIKASDYANRLKSLFSGHARSCIKNYKTINIFIYFPIIFLFHFAKAIKYSVKKKSLKVLFSFFYSVKNFFNNLPDTLKQRRIVQSKRLIKKDIFLKIKPPKFN